jgi:putative pyoverdin transport system ATP-binding/permease protein
MMTESFKNINDEIAERVELFAFLKKKVGFKLSEVLFAGAAGGLANTMLLITIAAAVYNLYSGESNVQMFLIFILLLVLMIVTQRVLYRRWVARLESAVDKTRSELCDKLTQSDLKTIEGFDKGEIYNRLTQELTNISQFGIYLVKGVQAVFIVLFTSLYILQVFAPALMIIAGLIFIASLIYLAMIKKVYAEYEILNRTDINYFNWLGDILYGRKEIKLNSDRRKDILSTGNNISEDLKKGKLKIGTHYNKSMVFTNAFFYFLFGSVVFILPMLYQINADTLIVLTAITIFLADPISNIVSVIPLFQKVAISINFIGQFEDALDNSAEEDTLAGSKNRSFKKIEMKNVKYRYTIEENEFLLGPVDLTVNKGEITFITGGNGCGKTTLAKILASLYKPEEGTINIDGTNITEIQNEYREMTYGIFSDFHLFEKTYGIDQNKISVVGEMLEKFDLLKKVELRGNTFSTLNLSTGQRKRLAMVVALAEEKDIYIFDEWAAEQDPEYRDYFYRQLLNELKRNSKTIIVVSHDERFFDAADKVIKMDYGIISSIVTKNKTGIK